MCLIGLLLPFKDKEYQKHKSRSSGHRHSERPHREGSHRHEKGASEQDSERPHRERNHRRENEEAKNSRAVAEDALARLCLSLEQSLLEEQQRWREQDMLDRSELHRLGLERGRMPSEEAPPYSLRDEAAARQPTPEPQHQKNGVADSAPCRRNGDSSVDSSALCCRNCVCTRCGSAIIKCPTVPELDDTRVRAFTESGADSRRRPA
ncbi:hypothetical protein C8A01DRAFT_13843 [Parachaetomium inaequale]|uniref:Uncharacterized protein n=1 Tax=Parachaetomium inaequale TaxID=2588326 RepID=A0AAN6PKP1_9PEZI|nr:hypothetical protein C8A01DRAFT_13843 [Parachaetomium inaequale]